MHTYGDTTSWGINTKRAAKASVGPFFEKYDIGALHGIQRYAIPPITAKTPPVSWNEETAIEN
jgi:hypothetical protein